MDPDIQMTVPYFPTYIQTYSMTDNPIYRISSTLIIYAVFFNIIGEYSANQNFSLPYISWSVTLGFEFNWIIIKELLTIFHFSHCKDFAVSLYLYVWSIRSPLESFFFFFFSVNTIWPCNSGMSSSLVGRYFIWNVYKSIFWSNSVESTL